MNKQAQVIDLIEYKAHRHGLSCEEIAATICVGRNTWFLRKREPECFRVKELEVLAKKLQISFIISPSGFRAESAL